MPRPRNPIPTIRCHKGSAVIDVLEGGQRRTVTLGRWGDPQVAVEYERILAEQRTGGRRHAVAVNEILLGFLKFAARHYVRADGTPTQEIAEYKLVCRCIRELYGNTPAANFGPLALKTLRQRMIDRGWCRTLINRRVGRVRRLLKWAVGEELVPADVSESLGAVQGLQRGRSTARESSPVLPVDDAKVDATLPHLTRHVRGLVELQRLTGCRPGEACAMRRADLDTNGPIWIYRPPLHKTAHKGRTRTITIGPRGQAVLREFFTPNLDDYLFSPLRSVEESRARRAAARKTPRWASHQNRTGRSEWISPSGSRPPGTA